MNEVRIRSILSAASLDSSITGLPSFYLSQLKLPTGLDFPLPPNLRLGHLVERIVSHLIKASANYKMLDENIQLIEDGRTIGEIDFIVSNIDTQEVIHLELAYKFYLYDPSISSDEIDNWIGPNRNDSLIQKLDKLKSHQFPLLYREGARARLDEAKPDTISQKLCLLAHLFIPYQSDLRFSDAYRPAIQGYYLNYKDFLGMDHSDKTYYIPQKTEWGVDPSDNQRWDNLHQILPHLDRSMADNQSVLCWRKHNGAYSALFIVWW
jgi:hypothetical protein